MGGRWHPDCLELWGAQPCLCSARTSHSESGQAGPPSPLLPGCLPQGPTSLLTGGSFRLLPDSRRLRISPRSGSRTPCSRASHLEWTAMGGDLSVGRAGGGCGSDLSSVGSVAASATARTRGHRGALPAAQGDMDGQGRAAELG